MSCCAYVRFVKGGDTRFYRFPCDPECRRQWIIATKRRDWTPTDHTCICSDHFVTGRDAVGKVLQFKVARCSDRATYVQFEVASSSARVTYIYASRGLLHAEAS